LWQFDVAIIEKIEKYNPANSDPSGQPEPLMELVDGTIIYKERDRTVKFLKKQMKKYRILDVDMCTSINPGSQTHQRIRAFLGDNNGA